MKTAVKERPILFSGPMVRAILEGRKTQTRRIIKPQPIMVAQGFQMRQQGIESLLCNPDGTVHATTQCPYGQPGDRLWVRETWVGPHRSAHAASEYRYRATDADTDTPFRGNWKPSIHMPRWASRLTLEITDVRVQRVQEIGEEDAEAEGDPKRGLIASENTHRDWYQSLWNSINGKGSWESNPWVWAISFRRLP